jgi:DNA-directed RNA polymerase sigma subunit (sigma70/sigma32)
MTINDRKGVKSEAMNQHDDKPTLEQYRSVKHLLRTVPERYFHVFEFRNGITDGNKHTSRETGQRFLITTTRVRQLEARVWYEVQQVAKRAF